MPESILYVFSVSLSTFLFLLLLHFFGGSFCFSWWPGAAVWTPLSSCSVVDHGTDVCMSFSLFDLTILCSSSPYFIVKVPTVLPFPGALCSRASVLSVIKRGFKFPS